MVVGREAMGASEPSPIHSSAASTVSTASIVSTASTASTGYSCPATPTPTAAH